MSLISKRLYIGNVHPEVCSEELSSKFNSFGQVSSVEIRTKNELTFSYIDIEFTDQTAVWKCIDMMNNTKWRGLMLKVQVAKENFMEKLKKEQRKGGEVHWGQKREKIEKIRPPDNFNFEIVNPSSGKISSLPQNQTKNHQNEEKNKKVKKIEKEKIIFDPNLSIPIKRTSQKIEDKSDEPVLITTLKEDQSPTPAKLVKKSKKIKAESSQIQKQAAPTISTESENVPSYTDVKMSKLHQNSENETKNSQKKSKISLINENNNSEDDESEDEKNGIPKFCGISSLNLDLENIQTPSPIFIFTHLKNRKKPSLKIVENTQKSANFTQNNADEAKNEEISNSSPAPFVLKINAAKRAKSDELRISSLISKNEFSLKRSKVVSNSLAPIINHIKKQKIIDVSTEASSFSLDDKIKIGPDEKTDFKNIEEEHSKQLNILDQIISPKKSTNPKNNPKLSPTKSQNLVQVQNPTPKNPSEIIRFDPTNPAHSYLVLSSKNSEENLENQTVSTKKVKKLKEKEIAKNIEEEKEKLKDVHAKATFKVAPNLKSLFSEDSPQNFSLLQTFSSSTVQNNSDKKSSKNHENREFSQKYEINQKDSDSLSENYETADAYSHNCAKSVQKLQSADSKNQKNAQKISQKGDNCKSTIAENSPKKLSKSLNVEKIKSADSKNLKNGPNLLKLEKISGNGETKSTISRNYFKADLFKKEPLFFSPSDNRLSSIFSSFLEQGGENRDETKRKFEESGRNELKIIARSKIRNAKRKGEKREAVLKLIRKKRRREFNKKQKKLHKI